jgi:hypothetical protein
MFLAAYMVVNMLPKNVSFGNALQLSGKLGKLNVITTGFEKGHFNWSDQYNLLSGNNRWFFSCPVLFWNGPEPGGSLSYCQDIEAKPAWFIDEWICESSHAIFDPAHRRIVVHFLPVQ